MIGSWFHFYGSNAGFAMCLPVMLTLWMIYGFIHAKMYYYLKFHIDTQTVSNYSYLPNESEEFKEIKSRSFLARKVGNDSWINGEMHILHITGVLALIILGLVSMGWGLYPFILLATIPGFIIFKLAQVTVQRPINLIKNAKQLAQERAELEAQSIEMFGLDLQGNKVEVKEPEYVSTSAQDWYR